MADETDTKRRAVIHGASRRDHHALSAYAAIHNIKVGEAFARAVAGLTGGLDGAEKVMFDRYMDAPEGSGFKRRGRKPAADGGTP